MTQASANEDSEIHTEAAANRAEETELWWGACSVRTLLPHLIVCFLLSCTVLVSAWSLGAWEDQKALHHTTVASLTLAWLLMVGFAAYRVSASSYRLTNRRLFVLHGFRLRSPANQGILLEKIEAVTVRRGQIARLLGTGDVHVRVKDETGQECIMWGVVNPKSAAVRVRKAVKTR